MGHSGGSSSSSSSDQASLLPTADIRHQQKRNPYLKERCKERLLKHDGLLPLGWTVQLCCLTTLDCCPQAWSRTAPSSISLLRRQG